jgi:hypothetical protein
MVYLIHFETKLHHCQHYIGFCSDKLFTYRIAHHLKGTGSRLMAAVNRAGIKWEVVRVWDWADGNFERKLKNRKNAKYICPVCRAGVLTHQN